MTPSSSESKFNFGFDTMANDDGVPCSIATPLDIGQVDFSNLPPRPWMYGFSSLVGMVSAVCGNGGSGKTSIEIAKGMAVAIGRDILATGPNDEAHHVHVQGNVLYWNLEDPEDEMIRRLYAEMLHRGVKKAELAGKFFVLSGRDERLCVAELDKNGKPTRSDITPIVDLLKSLGIVYFVVDPVVNAHGLDENSNVHLNMVIDQFRQIAHDAGCAVIIVHHFRKGGSAGDGEAARGAVALHAGVRVMETVVTMTKEDAEAVGVDQKDRRTYVRVDNAKANLSPGSIDIQWFKFTSVPLNNATLEYPKGDRVGVLDRWTPLDAMHGVTWTAMEQVLDQIDAGMNGDYYSKAVQSQGMYVGRLLMDKFGWTDKKTLAQVKEWLDAGVLIEDSYKSPKNQAKRNCVISTEKGREDLKYRMANRA
jgi:hypothetical protein